MVCPYAVAFAVSSAGIEKDVLDDDAIDFILAQNILTILITFSNLVVQDTKIDSRGKGMLSTLSHSLRARQRDLPSPTQPLGSTQCPTVTHTAQPSLT